MEFLQLNYNYVWTTTVDFVCNYNDNVMLMLLSIDQNLTCGIMGISW